MVLNDFGEIACNEWRKLSERYSHVLLDVFQIMPNHIHGIIALNSVGATLAVAQNNDANTQNDQRAGASPARTAIDNIVGAYKSLVANRCLKIHKAGNEYMGKLWQRNYWEHIIRNEQSYQNIANYIINNPANWENDEFYRE